MMEEQGLSVPASDYLLATEMTRRELEGAEGFVCGGQSLLYILLGVGGGEEPLAVHIDPYAVVQEALTEGDEAFMVYFFVEGAVVGEGGLGGEGHVEDGGGALDEDVFLVLAGQVSEAVHQQVADVVHVTDHLCIVGLEAVYGGLGCG